MRDARIKNIEVTKLRDARIQNIVVPAKAGTQCRSRKDTGFPLSRE
jgi:hypothetical protein